ncbi:hypothetical protein GCM10010420_15300 [Streptomyces glaucosporus]|uniref:Uncharacterized protein n=1 Tax=Streptomyces glaucosporus TaxID=284044 RepID=A0ABN3I045_9ACTN
MPPIIGGTACGQVLSPESGPGAGTADCSSRSAPLPRHDWAREAGRTGNGTGPSYSPAVTSPDS